MYHKKLFLYFRYNVIPILADIQSESVKEKVIRIILATFRVSCKYIPYVAGSVTFLSGGGQKGVAFPFYSIKNGYFPFEIEL